MSYVLNQQNFQIQLDTHKNQDHVPFSLHFPKELEERGALLNELTLVLNQMFLEDVISILDKPSFGKDSSRNWKK